MSWKVGLSIKARWSNDACYFLLEAKEDATTLVVHHRAATAAAPKYSRIGAQALMITKRAASKLLAWRASSQLKKPKRTANRKEDDPGSTHYIKSALLVQGRYSFAIRSTWKSS